MSSATMKADDLLPLSRELIEYSHRIGRAGEDPRLQKLGKFAATHEYANMNSAIEQVSLIQLLCRLMNARVAVEVGVYLGYTTLALAQALPADGRVIGLEIVEEFTQLAAPFWEEAGVRHKIDLRLGPALQSMQQLADESADLVYIDCDKPNYSNYVTCALKLVRIGGLILVDNTLWHGKVIDESNNEENTVAVRACNELIRNLDPTQFKIVNLAVGDGLTMLLRLK